VGKPKGKRLLEDWVIGRWIILECIMEIGWGGMDWIDLTPYRIQWNALVYVVMNLQVPYNVGNFLSG
jgi:hypothetical protein